MIQPRIPEGGAIEDGDSFNMEEYSKIMFKNRKKEYQHFAEELNHLITIPKNASVLEIGPGPAWITIFLAQIRPDLKIIGVEASPDMIRVATQNVKKMNCDQQINFIQGTVENLHEVISENFDLVFSNDSLHHWIDPEKAFKEIALRIKPEGKVCIHDSRRDLGLGGKLILYGFGKPTLGKMWKYWKSSIDASYTFTEIKEILEKIPLNWTVKPELMDLFIQTS